MLSGVELGLGFKTLLFLLSSLGHLELVAVSQPNLPYRVVVKIKWGGGELFAAVTEGQDTSVIGRSLLP